MDDGLEAEGAGMNTLVEGNYLSETFTGVASGAVGKGPLFIYRNVFGVSRMDPYISSDAVNCLPLSPLTNRGPFGKLGDGGGFGGGKRIYYHNTLLQPSPVLPATLQKRGAGEGPNNSAGPMTNTLSRNNIWQVWSAAAASIRDSAPGSATNNFDYDMVNGVILKGAATVIGTNLIDEVLTPIFDTANGHGNDAGDTGKYQLHSSSRGYNEGVAIPNFNVMTGVDVGAAQHGEAPMTFGCPW
jgi:hypothetical protein